MDLSVAVDLCQRVLALPMHPYLTAEDQEEVIRFVDAFIRKDDSVNPIFKQ